MAQIIGRASKPYARVQFRGVTLDQRTKSALIWAEKHYREAAPRKRQPWRLGQGSYNVGVGASAGTHDGGGVIDIMFAGLNHKQRKATVRWLRKAGFAAWAREGAAWGAGGSNDHAHAVLLGHRTASPAAKSQMDSYRAGRDGLAGNAPDHTWKPRRSRRWSHRQNRPRVGK
jgi:hypothetical protein